MVEHWEANSKAPNPYNEPAQGKWFPLYMFKTMSNLPAATTLQVVQLNLAQTENLQLFTGHAPWHKVSMTAFFLMGFNIKDQQYVLMSIGIDHSLMSCRFVFKHKLAQTKGNKTSKQLAWSWGETKGSDLTNHYLETNPTCLHPSCCCIATLGPGWHGRYQRSLFKSWVHTTILSFLASPGALPAPRTQWYLWSQTPFTQGTSW